MKVISSVSFSQAYSKHLGNRRRTVLRFGTGNQNSFGQFVGKRSCASRSVPGGDDQQNYSEVRVETLLASQPKELSHWSAMFDNNSPVLINGM